MTHVTATSLLLTICASSLACGGKTSRPKLVAANAVLGECVDPETAGVLSERPKLRRADRDLNGDGQDESVLADELLCKGGNCNWNLFAEANGCVRYIGSIGATSIEVLESSTDAGFHDLRAWWKLGGGERQLVQNYRYRGEGYQLEDVLICRQAGGDRLLCADEEQATD